MWAMLLIVSGLVGGLIWLLLHAQRDRVEAETERDDAREALKTERTYADATRDPADPDTARERLRKFGGGQASDRP